MILTTFKEEGIVDTENLIFKCLYIIVFTYPFKDTDLKIKYHPHSDILKSIHNNPLVRKFFFISLINPPRYNLVTRNLLPPLKRISPQEDFRIIDEYQLYDYLQVVQSISFTIALN